MPSPGLAGVGLVGGGCSIGGRVGGRLFVARQATSGPNLSCPRNYQGAKVDPMQMRLTGRSVGLEGERVGVSPGRHVTL